MVNKIKPNELEQIEYIDMVMDIFTVDIVFEKGLKLFNSDSDTD